METLANRKGSQLRHPAFAAHRRIRCCSRPSLVFKNTDSSVCGSDSTESLILAHRGAAIRMATKIVRSWRAKIEIDDIVSAVDFALVNAASRFNAKSGASFETFAWFSIRAELVKTVAFRAGQKRPQPAERRTVFTRLDSKAVMTASQAATPEEDFSRKERWALLGTLMSHLTPVQKKVMEGIYYQGKIESVIASELGFSREYIARVKRAALEKIGTELTGLGETCRVSENQSGLPVCRAHKARLSSQSQDSSSLAMYATP